MHYTKPSVTDFGTLRHLTQLGSGPDCDGGALGIGGPSDGSSTKCNGRAS